MTELLKHTIRHANTLAELNGITIFHPNFTEWANDMKEVYNRINAAMSGELDEVYDEIDSFMFDFDAELREAAETICNGRGYNGILWDTIVHYACLDLA